MLASTAAAERDSRNGTTLHKIASSFAVVAATALALTACSSGGTGSSDQAKAKSQLSAIASAVSQAAASASASSTDDATSSESTSSDPASPSQSSGASTDPAKVNVCALLNAADANAVAKADKLDDAQTASTTYKLTATKVSTAAGLPGCKFEISDEDGGGILATGGDGVLAVEVGPGSDIYEYVGGTKVPGLGDEAYTSDNAGTVVRVGGLLLTQGLSTFTSDMTVDLIRKMAPNLK